MGTLQAMREEVNPPPPAEPQVTGLSPDEMAEGLRAIMGIERGQRAQIGSMLGQGGAPFDPAAFARATAPLAGGTQRAVGALHAKSAGLKREEMWRHLQYQLQLQQMQMQRQQQRSGMLGQLGQGLGFLFGGPLGGAMGGGGGFGGGSASMTRPALPPASLPGGFGF